MFKILALIQKNTKKKKKKEINKNICKYLMYLFAKTTFLDFLLSGYNGNKLKERAAVGNPSEYGIFRAKLC